MKSSRERARRKRKVFRRQLALALNEAGQLDASRAAAQRALELQPSYREAAGLLEVLGR